MTAQLISKTDKMAILIRYVKVNYADREVEVKESFLEYFNLANHNAVGYANGIMKSFNKHNLNLRHLLGQAYDGASVMRSESGGVQGFVREAVSQS